MEKAFLEQVQEKMQREDLETASIDNEMLAHKDSGVKRGFLFLLRIGNTVVSLYINAVVRRSLSRLLF